jgi:hypothetical protein
LDCGDYEGTSRSWNSGTWRSKNASDKGNIRVGIRERYATPALLIPEGFPQSKKIVLLLRILWEDEAEKDTVLEILEAEFEVRHGRPQIFRP